MEMLGAGLKTWKQENGVEIDEVIHDYDARGFAVWVDNVFVVYILPRTLEQSEEMRVALDRGEDVKDWEDGHGNSIGTLIEKTRMMNREEEEDE